MWCPKCGCEKSKVVHTEKANNVRRWRRCVECGYPFTTKETMECDENDVKYARYTKLDDKQIRLFEDEH